MSINVRRDSRPDSSRDDVGDVWNTPRNWRDSAVEARLSPLHFNHVASTSSSLISDSHRVDGHMAAQLTRSHHGRVDKTRRLTSFTVADILGPRYGDTSLHHHHHQQQQQHGTVDSNDDSESTSTRSNDDLSSSVLSHDSSADGPSPTGSDRAHCWAEAEPQPSNSRELYVYILILLFYNDVVIYLSIIIASDRRSDSK